MSCTASLPLFVERDCSLRVSCYSWLGMKPVVCDVNVLCVGCAATQLRDLLPLRPAAAAEAGWRGRVLRVVSGSSSPPSGVLHGAERHADTAPHKPRQLDAERHWYVGVRRVCVTAWTVMDVCALVLASAAGKYDRQGTGIDYAALYRASALKA